MIKVEFFGNFRLKFKTAETTVNASNMKELIEALCNEFPEAKKDIVNAVFFLNDKAVTGTFKKRIKLNEGDKIMMLSPSGGG